MHVFSGDEYQRFLYKAAIKSFKKHPAHTDGKPASSPLPCLVSATGLAGSPRAAPPRSLSQLHANSDFLLHLLIWPSSVFLCTCLSPSGNRIQEVPVESSAQALTSSVTGVSSLLSVLPFLFYKTRRAYSIELL